MLVLLLSCVVAAVLADKHTTELQEHYNHVSYIAGFPCHHPQSRVYSVEELFAEDKRADKAYFPDVTVLHTCDNHSGCCTSGQYCQPKHKIKVNLPFKVTFLKDVGGHKKGSWAMEHYDFYNHTECHCAESSVYDGMLYNVGGESSPTTYPALETTTDDPMIISNDYFREMKAT